MFQFHKGSIKTRDYLIRSNTSKGFNSTKVRLRLYKAQIATGYINAFQFHKGSIKTGQLSICFSGKSMFQFHKGSIKTSFF